MTDITTKAVEWSEKKKKISYDIDEKMLNMLDEMAGITHCTRAQVLDAIIFPGARAQTEIMLKLWKEWIKDKKFEGKEKQEMIKKIIKDTEAFKKKWGFGEFTSSIKEGFKKSLEGYNPKK
jgi:hypothetical protein